AAVLLSGVHEFAAAGVEHRLRGNGKGVLQGAGGNGDANAHARPQLRNRALDGDSTIEVAVPGRPGGAANRLDFAAQLGAWDGDDGQLGGLTLRDVPSIQFADARGRAPTAQ